MIIVFPKIVDYRYFYGTLLEQMLSFMSAKKDNKLILNVEKTEHIKPGVLCALLSFLKYQSIQKQSSVHFLFGDSVKLRSYLEDSMFFFYSEVGKLFTTDIVDRYSFASNKYKAIYTNKIYRINVPFHNPKRKLCLPRDKKSDVFMHVHDIYQGPKIKNMDKNNLKNPNEIGFGFAEIIENAYGHNYMFVDSNCYYTFQNYQRSYISLSCSDIGMGIYDSLYSKFFYDESIDEKYIEHKEIERQEFESINILPMIPKIFSLDEYDGFKNVKTQKNLAGMLECMVSRLGCSESTIPFGFPYIFQYLILEAKGSLILHCEDTLLTMDTNFLKDYFKISPKGILNGYKTMEMRELVLNPNRQFDEIRRGRLRIYKNALPGVHITVEVGGNRSDG